MMVQTAQLRNLNPHSQSFKQSSCSNQIQVVDHKGLDVCNNKMKNFKNRITFKDAEKLDSYRAYPVLGFIFFSSFKIIWDRNNRNTGNKY
jgi:hypothetical protein